MDISDSHYFSVVFLNILMLSVALSESLYKWVLAHSSPKMQTLQGEEMHALCFTDMSTEDIEEWHVSKVISS